MAQAGPWANYSSFAAANPSDANPVNCRAILVSCTIAGNVTLTPNKTTSAGTPVAFAVPIGVTVLPIELNEGFLNATGTTATATYVLLQ
jgi:hypothetical protein